MGLSSHRHVKEKVINGGIGVAAHLSANEAFGGSETTRKLDRGDFFFTGKEQENRSAKNYCFNCCGDIVWARQCSAGDNLLCCCER